MRALNARARDHFTGRTCGFASGVIRALIKSAEADVVQLRMRCDNANNRSRRQDLPFVLVFLTKKE